MPLVSGVGVAVVVVMSVLVFALESTGSAAANGLAQFLYIAPLLAALVLLVIATLRSQRTSREQLMWGYAAAMLGFLALAEGLYEWLILTGAPVPPHPGWLDLPYCVCALIAFLLLAHLAGILYLPPAVRTRVISDFIVLMALAGALLYAVWARTFSAFGVSYEAAGAASFYELMSVVAGGVAVMVLYMRRNSPRPPGWSSPLMWGFGVFAIALTGWPALYVAGEYGYLVWLAHVIEALYSLGFGLVALAALLRVLTGLSWDPPSPQARHIEGDARASLVMTGLVLLSAAVLALLAWLSPEASVAQQVYMTALGIAAVGIVARTVAVGIERREVRDRAMTDTVSGVGNERWFYDRADLMINGADRSSAQLAMVNIELDDFDWVNQSLGYREGDRLLGAVARALVRAAGKDAVVCRVAGDDFAVLAPVRSAEDAERLGQRFVVAVRSASTPRVTMSASVGVAVFPDDAVKRDALIGAAQAAQEWAKFHGKDRYVMAGSGVVYAPDLAEQVRMTEASGRVELARGLAAAVDARDPSNPYHGRNVAALAMLVGERLGWGPEDLARLEAAALLHDVGTLALPDHVLESNRPAALQSRREHSELGERFCDSIGFADVAPWIRSHHERWDGSGFPDGLEGEDIPLAARIISLCDAYDLLTGGDGRRGGLSQGAALQEIDLGIGSRFDPELAEQFIAVVGEHGGLGWVDGTVA